MFCFKRKKKPELSFSGIKPNEIVVQTAEKDSIYKILDSENKELRLKKEVEKVVDGEIWVINKFFSSKLCEEIIKFSEKKGFGEALLNVGNGFGVLDKEFRDCSRVMFDDTQTASYLAEILRPYVPLCQEGALYFGMNERFRILKYLKNQKFQLHMDGIWNPQPSIFSVLTIQIYLCNVNRGGSTRFEWEGWDQNEYHCKSEQGKAVIFRQNGWWHEGTHVLEGQKYTVRNDLMYQFQDEKEWKKIENEYKDKCCGLCNKNIISEKLDCGHLFLYCGCCPFYNGDIHEQAAKKKQCRKCTQCKKTIKNISNELYNIL